MQIRISHNKHTNISNFESKLKTKKLRKILTIFLEFFVKIQRKMLGTKEPAFNL